ncbi:hypothetical protein HOE31_04420 [bacterium]|jgi:cytochrome c oxidase subunit 2|nr:hypothetical protein [bacterium]MBT4122164.1 hypothetical protein [bacterium]MBT4335296.1 hypothetical protein [bacterium]MBT4495629.1 hypothetical protein [bacterium]MBT4763579.1 hypothetical protein [bacterium]
MNKIILSLFMLPLVILLSGCLDNKASQDSMSAESHDSDNQIEALDEDEMNDDSDNSEMKEFSLIAKKWEFEPSVITVNEGDMVKLKITSIDVDHGIAIPDFDINVDLNVNEEVEVIFEADKVGTFSFTCSIYCGSGHIDMTGTLIIK